MKPRPAFASIVAMLALLVSVANTFYQTSRAQSAAPQAVTGSGFTYQGRLDDSGAPANGVYDFEFALFDDATTGSQIGAILAVPGVTVVNGVFTVQLDFGNPFWQQQTFLEVRVRPGGGGSYTTLTPRQPVSAAPVASALPGVFTNQAAQFVGVGRTNKITGSEVFGVNADFGATGNNYGGMYVNTVSSEGKPFYGYATGDSFRAWTTYNPNPDNSTSPNLNNGALEVYSAFIDRPMLQVRNSRIAQPNTAHGLAKAGVFADCSSTSPTIARSFVSIVTASPTVPTPTASISWNSGLDACVIDFGFDISQRYYVATAIAASPRFVTCAYASGASLYCKRFTDAGVRENGNIVVLIF